jgi:hypothetical protein
MECAGLETVSKLGLAVKSVEASNVDSRLCVRWRFPACPHLVSAA